MSCINTVIARCFEARILIALLAVLGAFRIEAAAIYESEPNDTPATANPVAGPVRIAGVQVSTDQDGYMWTVSDEDARKRWTFELQGIADAVTVVDVFTVEFADNGTDVVSKTRLFTLGTRGARTVTAENLIFDPGRYVLGVAHAGGGRGGEPPDTGGLLLVDLDTEKFTEETATSSDDEELPADAAADTAADRPIEERPGAYRLTVREGDKLVVAERTAGNTKRADAAEIRTRREHAAFYPSSTAWYRLSIPENSASQRWRLESQTAVGHEMTLSLYEDPEAEPITKARTNDHARLKIPDLGLPAGDYWIELSSEEGDVIRTVASAVTGQRVSGEEAEPNDDWEAANHVDLAVPTTGRAGVKGDEDYFAFDWPEERAGRTHTLHFESPTKDRVKLCLLNDRGQDLQCREGSGTIELVDLLLTPGRYGFRFDRGDEGTAYRIGFDEGETYRAGREVEPNDRVSEAVALPDNHRVKGRLLGRETDVYRITVADEPQLWRFQAIGGGIRKMIYYDGAGAKVEEQRFPRKSRRARLPNVFLLPGNHFLALEGEDSEYTLLARALGPPDMNAEREPNDDDSRFHRLAVGQERTGLLSEESDVDGYRFFLAHRDRIRLTATPPVDGAVQAELRWENLGGARQLRESAEPGEPLSLAGVFPPGNYQLKLSPAQVSEAEYHLVLERLPRFDCPADCEPNDHRAMASPLPRNHRIEGSTGDWYKADYYRLPVFDDDTPIRIQSERNVLNVVTQTSNDDLAEYDRDTGRYRAILPADIPTYLAIYTAEDYRLEIEFPSGAREPVNHDRTPLAVTLELDADRVAAYRRHGQRVTGTLRITNDAGEPGEVALDGTTSDYRWHVDLGAEQVTVPAGESAELPVSVLVPADAWSDRAVRISIRAADAKGGHAEAFTDIIPDPHAKPVALQRYWSLPAALRGGPNVAWSVLGGSWVATDEQREQNEIFGVGSGYLDLFDNLAVKGRGLAIKRNQDRTSVLVELAGDEPVPVAGMTLNPLGTLSIDNAPRRFALKLSPDGERYTTVLEAIAEPIPAEQAFVLDDSVAARYARLELIDNFTGEDQPPFGLGEWKVIAEPGTDVSGGVGHDLAVQALGGHVVWSEPTISSQWDNTILKEDEKDPYAVKLSAGERLEWVVGFHHQRAARIARFEWLADEHADDDERIERVTISATMDSPFGPWTPVAEWDLTGDQLLRELTLEEPVWARYLKYTVSAPTRSARRAPPERIGIIEQVSGVDYRSVLTEWGFTSKDAYYESNRPLDPRPAFSASGNNDRESAASLELDKRVAGSVQLGSESDWYRLTVPEGGNLLELTLRGEPTVRTRLYLEDAAGEPVVLPRSGRRTASHGYEAVVSPGEEYWIHVVEPPRNVVFSWDTSASVGAYLPVVYNALMAYAEDVVPGRDGVNFIPFGSSPLVGDWYGEPYVIQTLLNELPRNTSSSAAEKTLATAGSALAPRPGTKAVVLITDAATTRHARMWPSFRKVRPRIFALGLSSDGAFSRNPPREQDLLQGWTDVNGGHYDHVLTAGQMEVAFDRAATLLRAPAPYELSAAVRFDENAGKPGLLRVVAGGDDGNVEDPLSGAVELILDASGSMLQRMEGRRRIDIAKELLIGAVSEELPTGTPLALRVFGHKEPNACRTDLEQPLAPLDAETITARLRSIEARNLARTPIADSLGKVRGDLEDTTGRRTVVLVTDGKETCDGDPKAVIESLAESGFDVTLNIVGFAIDDPALSETFREWANLGGGRYLSAGDPEELNAALTTALRTAYEVRDKSDVLVAESTVGGDAVKLEAGYYNVTVRSSPVITFDDVEVAHGDEMRLQIDTRR